MVGIIMGSTSDLPVMQDAADILKEFGVPYELTIVSAHRTPERMFEYAKTASGRGIQVIIAGAGGAAHLPGMLAAFSPLPVIGVPVKAVSLSGLDSLLSIAQMPAGVPVGTLAIGEAVGDDREWKHDADFPMTLVFNRSKWRFDEPGKYQEMVRRASEARFKLHTREREARDQLPDRGRGRAR